MPNVPRRSKHVQPQPSPTTLADRWAQALADRALELGISLPVPR